MGIEVDRRTIVALEKRYGDAYLTARVIDGFGTTVKTLALIFGALGIAGAFLLAVKGGIAGAFAAFGGLAGTVIITLVIYIFGSLVAAQGQILKATLDTAVNSSPFLPAESRIRIMSLPSAPVERQASSPVSSTSWGCPSCGRSNEAKAMRCAVCGEERVA